jgi:glycine/D-amino acid oxidase-like deaminating enzyme
MKDSFADTSFHLAAPKGFPDGWGTARSWPKDGPSPFEVCRVLEPAPNQNFLQRMQERWAERFPTLEKVQIKESWAGMIDAMPDVVPVVDRVPHLQGLIIATGMSGHGFGIGPGMGMAIAKMTCGDQTDHDMSRFRFNRFSDGSPLIMGPAL